MPRKVDRAPQPPRVPSYCRHRATGQTYVKVRRKAIYLGAYGSDASRSAYAAVVADVLAGREPVLPTVSRSSAARTVTVREVCDRFIAHARGYYVKQGVVTGEAGLVANACRRVAALFGDLAAYRRIGRYAWSSRQANWIGENAANRSTRRPYSDRLRFYDPPADMVDRSLSR